MLCVKKITLPLAFIRFCCTPTKQRAVEGGVKGCDRISSYYATHENMKINSKNILSEHELL